MRHRLSADWQAAYGHPILAVVSLVDAQRFRCTAHKVAGYTRVSEDFYVVHGRPKTLYVRLLRTRAAQWLRQPQLPAALAPYVRPIKPHCRQRASELG